MENIISYLLTLIMLASVSQGNPYVTWWSDTTWGKVDTTGVPFDKRFAEEVLDKTDMFLTTSWTAIDWTTKVGTRKGTLLEKTDDIYFILQETDKNYRIGLWIRGTESSEDGKTKLGQWINKPESEALVKAGIQRLDLPEAVTFDEFKREFNSEKGKAEISKQYVSWWGDSRWGPVDTSGVVQFDKRFAEEVLNLNQKGGTTIVEGKGKGTLLEKRDGIYFILQEAKNNYRIGLWIRGTESSEDGKTKLGQWINQPESKELVNAGITRLGLPADVVSFDKFEGEFSTKGKAEISKSGRRRLKATEVIQRIMENSGLEYGDLPFWLRHMKETQE